MRIIFSGSLLLLATLMAAADVLSSAGKPVVVELFTSEGCSSCPPADALLRQFDGAQPVAGVQVIVLSEHVDYWNHIGWKDPYSSRFFSDRQSTYSERFGLATVYTPQMVVGGSAEFTGSDSERAVQEIKKANSGQNVAVALSGVSLQSGFLRAHLHADPSPDSAKSADVMFAVALNHAESQVLRGENSGRRLSHAGVVQQLIKVGSVDGTHGFDNDIQVKLDPQANPSALRAIAFLQLAGQGRILGGAMQQIAGGR